MAVTPSFVLLAAGNKSIKSIESIAGFALDA